MLRYIYKLSCSCLLLLLLFVGLAPHAFSATVTTQPVTEIADTTAVGNGSVIDPFLVTAYGVCWSTYGLPGLDDRCTNEGITLVDVNFSTKITGLSPNTKYNVRAYARELFGATSYGNVVEFTTQTGLPIVTTQPVTDIEEKTALGHGTIVDMGSSNPSQHGVCWNTTGMPTTQDNRTREGRVSKVGPFTSQLKDLKKDTTYYVRAYATNRAGTAYGNEVSFSMQPSLPIVSTQTVTEIGQRQASITGTIIDLGAPNPSAHGFCWNTDGLPDIEDDVLNLGEINESGDFSAVVEPLLPGTTYFVRAFATNTAGTAYGDQLSFTTTAMLPLVLTDEVTEVGTHSVIAGGILVELGQPPPNQHGICWNLTGNPSLSDNRIDNGPANNIGPFVVSMEDLVPDTTYYVKAYASNTAGTVYGEEISFKTVSSALAPIATLSDVPPKITNSSIYTIGVGGIGVISYKFRLDDNNWSVEQSIQDAIHFELNGEGLHTIEVIGKNGRNMWQSLESPTQISWFMDTTAPVAEIFNFPTGSINSDGTKIVVGGQDVISYRYRIDGGEWSNTVPIDILIGLAGLSSGEHVLEVIGADQANNWQDEIMASRATWIHNPEIPTAVLIDIPERITNKTSVSLSVTYPENGVPIDAYAFTIDNGRTWLNHAANEVIELTGLDEGDHSICVNARAGDLWQDGLDGMSSTGNATCIQWRVDITPVDPVLLSTISEGIYATTGHGLPGTSSVLLTWEWNSDTDLESIQRYRIWYSADPITTENLDSATEIYCDLIPSKRGIQEFYAIDGLTPDLKYYFSLKTIDGAGNLSELSNVVSLIAENKLPQINTLILTEGGLITDNASAKEIRLDGLNFMETTGCNLVRLENTSRAFDLVSKTGSQDKIFADIPVGSPPGNYRARVINKHGISSASSEWITIIDAQASVPVVLEVHPLVAQIGTQTVLTIIGENFGTENAEVNLLSENGIATALTSVVVHDPETITAIVDVSPNFAEGQYHVQVVNAEGRLNEVSVVRIELHNPLMLESDGSAILTSKIIVLGDEPIPATTMLTTDDRSEVSTISSNRAKVKIFLDSGTAFEIGSQDKTTWADYSGSLRPPRQIPIRNDHQIILGQSSASISVGIDDFLRLKNDLTMFVLFEISLTNQESNPSIFYISPEGDLSLAGVDGEWRGLELYKGGTILSKRMNTPEDGLTSYAIGLLLTSMSDYAIGTMLLDDPDNGSDFGGDVYGLCFVSSLNTANMILMHSVIIFSIIGLAFIYLKRNRR